MPFPTWLKGLQKSFQAWLRQAGYSAIEIGAIASSCEPMYGVKLAKSKLDSTYATLSGLGYTVDDVKAVDLREGYYEWLKAATLKARSTNHEKPQETLSEEEPEELTIADVRSMLSMMDGSTPVRMIVGKLRKVFTINRQPALVRQGGKRVVCLAIAREVGPIPKRAQEQIADGPLGNGVV